MPRKAPILFADASQLPSWRVPPRYGGDGAGARSSAGTDGGTGNGGTGDGNGRNGRERRAPPPLPPRPPTPEVDFELPFSGSGWMVVPPDGSQSAPHGRCAPPAKPRPPPTAAAPATLALSTPAPPAAAPEPTEPATPPAPAPCDEPTPSPSPRAVPSWRSKYTWSDPEALVEVASAGGSWLSFEIVGESAPRVLRRRVPPPRPPPPDDDGLSAKDERRLLLAARRSQALRPLRQQRGELRWRKTPNVPARPLRCW